MLALERFAIPHEMGSSYGATRIIRKEYFEHPSYVPLLQRAYELWRELEREAGEELLHITGSLDAGAADSRTVLGSLRSCEAHGLPYEVLTRDEVARRFPGFRLPPDFMAVLQPDGGFLEPERCVVEHARLEQRLGDDVRTGEMLQADGIFIRDE